MTSLRIMPLELKIPGKNYFYLIAAFSFVIILASIVLALYTITDNYRSLSYLDNAYGVNARIDRIYSTLKDEENQQRGYLITYQPVFLKTLEHSEKAVNAEYEALYEVLKNEKGLKEHLMAFKVEIAMKIRLLKLGQSYFASGRIRGDSLDKILVKGDFVMSKLRETVNKMKKTEYRRFSQLRHRTFTKSELSIFIIALTSGISILLLISILFRLKREHDTKTLLSEQLAASEKHLQQQVEKLNLSNKELELFAYIASHDLEEPLRKITSFSEKIQVKLGTYPDEEVIDSLQRLKSAAARMRVFISDLLNYSRVTRLLDINEAVNLDAVFKAVIDDLEVRISAKKAVVTVQPLDEVKGNNTQIRQLFQNLLSNALKFGDKAVTTVTVSAGYYDNESIQLTDWANDLVLKRKKYYCIFVADNGIGFELKYLKQIFIIFQRLHIRSEYEGTGIGLAICKRIVENHEGFITAKSEVGKGTTFIVGLPVK